MSGHVLYSYAGGAAPFNPNTISNLGLWLNATSNTSFNSGAAANGDSVALWKDLSASANDASQASSTAQPIYTTNVFGTQPAVLFTAASFQNLFVTTLVKALTEFSVFIVTKPQSFTSNDYYLAGPAAGTGHTFNSTLANINQSSAEIWDGGDNGYEDCSYPAMTAGTAATIQLISTGQPSTMKLYISNVLASNVGGGGAAVWDMNYRSIGSSVANNRFIDSYVGEILIYHRSVSGAEQTALYSYLNTKWGAV